MTRSPCIDCEPTFPFCCLRTRWSPYLEVHPRQRVSAQHCENGQTLGCHESREVHQQRDTAGLPLGFPLLVSQALDGLSTDQTSVRVHYHDDLPSLVGMNLNLGAQGRGIIVEALVRGLSTHTWVCNSPGLVALRVQLALDDLEAIWRVPCARREDKDGSACGSG